MALYSEVREALTLLDLDVLIYPCPKGGTTFRARARELSGKEQFPLLVDPNTGIPDYIPVSGVLLDIHTILYTLYTGISNWSTCNCWTYTIHTIYTIHYTGVCPTGRHAIVDYTLSYGTCWDMRTRASLSPILSALPLSVGPAISENVYEMEV